MFVGHVRFAADGAAEFATGWNEAGAPKETISALSRPAPAEEPRLVRRLRHVERLGAFRDRELPLRRPARPRRQALLSARPLSSAESAERRPARSVAPRPRTPCEILRVQRPAMTRTQRITLAATGLGLFMIFLDALIVNVALPSIQHDFGVGESGLQWVVTAYSLGMAVAIMSAGTLADIFGRRRLYLLGIALFTASSVTCGLARLSRGAQRRPGGAGRGRRDRQRDVARPRLRRLSGSEAEGLGDRHLDGDRVHGARDRADARRLPRRTHRLALHLPGQRARRPGGPRC